MSTFSIKVPVFQKQIADHHKYKDQILDLIKINSMGYIKKGDVVDIISDYDLSRNHPRPYLSLVTDRVIDCLVDFKDISDFYKGVEISCFFFQQYMKEQYHGWHVHADCQYNGVYYLDLPEGSPKTEYMDPFTNNICQLDVKEGDVVAFPSFLVHRAPPNPISSLKTIISFNFNFK